APWLPPWAVIVHKGRKSGREYRTPVLSWRSGNRLEVVLYYGADTDWVRNVLAAGEAGVVRGRRTWRLTAPRVVAAAESAPAGRRDRARRARPGQARRGGRRSSRAGRAARLVPRNGGVTRFGCGVV